jgi:transcriptional antiterminator RfaH
MACAEVANPRWYVARTKTGQENVAFDNLTRQNFNAYYPRVAIERLRHGRITTTTEQLFPGYILVSMVLEIHAWRIINNTYGVIRLLSFMADGTPSPLPIGEVEQLQQRESAGQLRISEIRQFRRGDLIRMKVGPAVDQLGTVVRTRGERVEWLMRLLGQQVRCIGPMHAVELVGKSKPRSVR